MSLTQEQELALHDNLAVHLDGILSHFKPGAKVTVVIRNVGVVGDAGVVIGNDDLNEAISEIKRRMSVGQRDGVTV